MSSRLPKPALDLDVAMPCKVLVIGRDKGDEQRVIDVTAAYGFFIAVAAKDGIVSGGAAAGEDDTPADVFGAMMIHQLMLVWMRHHRASFAVALSQIANEDGFAELLRHAASMIPKEGEDDDGPE